LTKCKIEEELCSTKVNSAEVSKLETEKTSLQGKLDDISDKMNQSAKALEKEQSKNRSAWKHTEV